MNYPGENAEKGSGVSDNASDSKTYKVTVQMQEVLDYLSQYDAITDDELMELLNLKRTRAYMVANQMADMRLIDIIGRGKDKKYILHK